MESKVAEIQKKLIKDEDIKNNSKILGGKLDENNIFRECVNINIQNRIKDSVHKMISNIDFFSCLNEDQFVGTILEN